jgi:acyl carrier protein
MTTYEESLAITTELLRRYVDKARAIRAEDHIQADLGLDSIAVMEFAADLEERCRVDIPADEYQKLFTVADVARSIVRLSAQSS